MWVGPLPAVISTARRVSIKSVARLAKAEVAERGKDDRLACTSTSVARLSNFQLDFTSVGLSLLRKNLRP